MYICVAGDVHGHLDEFYLRIIELEKRLGLYFEWIFQVGDLGIWPTSKVDSATKRHGGPGNFPTWWAAQKQAPIRTLFIKGNHEDFTWLDNQPPEILGGLHHLRNGERTTIHSGAVNPATEVVDVVGLGGCYSPRSYVRDSSKLRQRKKRHYTKDEIEKLTSSYEEPPDVLLLHDTPLHKPNCTPAYSEGLRELIISTGPRICFFGHQHEHTDNDIDGIRCVGLNKIGNPGNLVAMEISKTKLDILEIV